MREHLARPTDMPVDPAADLREQRDVWRAEGVQAAARAEELIAQIDRHRTTKPAQLGPPAGLADRVAQERGQVCVCVCARV